MGIEDKESVEQVRVPSLTIPSITAHVIAPESMADEVRKHDKIMGTTGQGLESEERIIEGMALAQTWGEYVFTAWYTICLPICCLKLRSRKFVCSITK